MSCEEGEQFGKWRSKYTALHPITLLSYHEDNTLNIKGDGVLFILNNKNTKIMLFALDLDWQNSLREQPLKIEKGLSLGCKN